MKIMSKGINKIKIAHVVTRLDWGGPPDIIRLICKSLDPEKFDVTIIVGSTGYPSLKTQRFLSEYSVITIPQLQREVNPANDITALFRLYYLLREKKFDIVHTHTAKAGALGRIAARFAGVPRIIHTSHGHNFYGYFGPFKSKLVIMIERFLTHFTGRITALTELEKRDLASYQVAQPDKVVVINSGIELDQFRKVTIDSIRKREELGISRDSLVVGMIGRLEPVKGSEYFIEAIHEVSKKIPDAEFLVVGEGSLRHKLISQCKKLKISEKVTFTGWREDIQDILAILDVLTLPSLNEAVGRILIEAGACGIPVVATNVGGIPEVVQNGETGILVSPHNSNELARALISLLENEEERLSMGEAAKYWVDDKCSASRMVKRFSELYSEMVDLDGQTIPG